jgi:IS5 family transposase
MDVSAMANNVNPNNSSTSVSVMKKAMEVDQQAVNKVLEDSQQQLQKMQQDQVNQQAVAAKTGIGNSLNILA